MTHLNHLSLYVSQVAWFLPVSFFNVQIYFLVLLLVLNTIESDGFLWRASRRLKTLFLAHCCFQTRRSSFLEPACLPNTRIHKAYAIFIILVFYNCSCVLQTSMLNAPKRYVNYPSIYLSLYNKLSYTCILIGSHL